MHVSRTSLIVLSFTINKVPLDSNGLAEKGETLLLRSAPPARSYAARISAATSVFEKFIYS